jgi:hypothetical protein
MVNELRATGAVRRDARVPGLGAGWSGLRHAAAQPTPAHPSGAAALACRC